MPLFFSGRWPTLCAFVLILRVAGEDPERLETEHPGPAGKDLLFFPSARAETRPTKREEHLAPFWSSGNRRNPFLVMRFGTIPVMCGRMGARSPLATISSLGNI